ncbi:HMA2 domain-containing protein [Kamptonema formosum]|uniref:HMA2 domain-containing protein n=1 Tax=Kamptonema formosum TaxID=331992 RepID=UPI00034C5DE0|nr:hypothetical protein [Oscillatoria sp. PCC 10802]
MVRNDAKIIPLNGASLKPAGKPMLARIVSQTRGRIRLRVTGTHRNHRYMEEIASALRARADVCDVRTNPDTGSIVVHHINEEGVVDDIAASLWDVGVIVGHITHGESLAAAEVSNAFADLNEHIAHATGGMVDMRFLVPVGLGALAIRQLLVKGLQLEIVPWYVLAWYSFDSFLKLHYTKKPEYLQTPLPPRPE